MIFLVPIAVLCGIFVFLSPQYAFARWAALGLLAAMTGLAAQFSRHSRTDDLTGLGNLRQLRAMEHAYRHSRDLGIWYFDVDHLKQVNDTEGHSTGDRLLIHFASRLRSCNVPGARAYRIGGDEFLLIVPQPSGDPAPPLPDASDLPASWGYAGGPGPQLSELILLAEQEMYRSRRIAETE